MESEGYYNIHRSDSNPIPILSIDSQTSYTYYIDMNTVTISPKFQVVIPRQIRESLKLRSGQKVQVIEYDGRVELVPLLTMKSLRGSIRIADTTIAREDDRL